MDDPQIGDAVRSFDFDGRDLTGERACYVVGIVESRVMLDGCERYRIRVLARIFRGEAICPEDAGRSFAHPPVNGTQKLFGGVCSGVEVVPS